MNATHSFYGNCHDPTTNWPTLDALEPVALVPQGHMPETRPEVLIAGVEGVFRAGSDARVLPFVFRRERNDLDHMLRNDVVLPAELADERVRVSRREIFATDRLIDEGSEVIVRKTNDFDLLASGNVGKTNITVLLGRDATEDNDDVVHGRLQLLSTKYFSVGQSTLL